MVKAKRKTRRGKGDDGTLETLLRFEIIVVLFSLIGLYYFLSFSPIRMPSEPIASSPEMIAPPPPQSEPQVEPEAEVEKPAAGSETAQVTVAAELPLAKPLVASVSVATGEADTSSGEINQARGSGNTEMVAESEPSTLPKREPTDLSPEKVKVPTDAPVSGSQADSVPATVVSAPASLPAPLVAKPEPRPQTVLAPSEKSTPTPPLPPRTIVAGEYVLRVDFLQNRDKLEALNFKVKTETVRRPTPMYRVYLGTFPQQKKALETMAVVRKKGDDPFLQACSGGYNVVIGSFYLHSSVVAWENMYHASGFEPKVQKVTLEMPHTLLLLDGPAVQSDPDAVLAKLKAAGFPDPHLK
jgi:hypothetical protein